MCVTVRKHGEGHTNDITKNGDLSKNQRSVQLYLEYETIANTWEYF